MMHSTAISVSPPPAFLSKLWKLVEDPKCNDLICWNPATNGATFIIRDQARFAKELLPLYFKHNNMSSFVRQLNMYGFRKVTNIEQGGLKADKDEMEFQHMYFLQGFESLLENIKRKVTNLKVPPQTQQVKEEPIMMSPEVINKVMTDVQGLIGRQTAMETKFGAMKKENEMLWREIAFLRKKHIHQQQIINQLVQFLLSLAQSNRLGPKRKYPLMLNDSAHSEAKSSRLTRTLSLDATKGAEIRLATSSDSTSSSGPIIRDITNQKDVDMFWNETSPVPSANGDVTSVPSTSDDVIPGTSEESQGLVLQGLPQEEQILPSDICQVDLEDESPPIKPDKLDEIIKQITSADDSTLQPIANSANTDDLPQSDTLVPVADKLWSWTDANDHFESMQCGINSIKEFLSTSNGCSLDHATILELFTPNDYINKPLSDSELGRMSGNDITGTELTKYSPLDMSFFDEDIIPDTDTFSQPLFEDVLKVGEVPNIAESDEMDESNPLDDAVLMLTTQQASENEPPTISIAEVSAPSKGNKKGQ